MAGLGTLRIIAIPDISQERLAQVAANYGYTAIFRSSITLRSQQPQQSRAQLFGRVAITSGFGRVGGTNRRSRRWRRGHPHWEPALAGHPALAAHRRQLVVGEGQSLFFGQIAVPIAGPDGVHDAAGQRQVLTESRFDYLGFRLSGPP